LINVEVITNSHNTFKIILLRSQQFVPVSFWIFAVTRFVKIIRFSKIGF